MWSDQFDRWRSIAPLKTFPPLDSASLTTAKERLNGMPVELERFYRESNGLSAGYFKVLPIETVTDIERAWDGLYRANDPRVSRFLGGSVDLLGRFLVFADIGVSRSAAFDRRDGSIWYEENGKLQQTDLSLSEFIETSLREMADG